MHFLTMSFWVIFLILSHRLNACPTVDEVYSQAVSKFPVYSYYVPAPDLKSCKFKIIHSAGAGKWELTQHDLPLYQSLSEFDVAPRRPQIIDRTTEIDYRNNRCVYSVDWGIHIREPLLKLTFTRLDQNIPTAFSTYMNFFLSEAEAKLFLNDKPICSYFALRPSTSNPNMLTMVFRGKNGFHNFRLGEINSLSSETIGREALKNKQQCLSQEGRK